MNLTMPRILHLIFLLLVAAALPASRAFSPTVLAAPARSENPVSSTLLRSTISESSDTTDTSMGPNPSKVQKLTSLDDFLNYIDGAPPDSLAVVKFYAKICPLCKRIEMKYKKMSRFYSTAPIQFAEIEKTAHPDLFSVLGVDTYPYIQIYRNGQCVAAHGTESDKTFEPVVHDTVQRELMMSPEDWNSFLHSFAGPIQAMTQKVDKLRSIATNDDVAQGSRTRLG